MVVPTCLRLWTGLQPAVHLEQGAGCLNESSHETGRFEVNCCCFPLDSILGSSSSGTLLSCLFSGRE